ncbi:MAG TPA: hypothetical protein PLO24_08810, partial [Bacteroidales bacterium]|nr:hypothetical protein [Bacteroidales bacterium]
VDMRMKAYLSLANALKSPKMRQYDRNEVERIAVNAMQVNTPEDYLNRLTRPMFPRMPIRPEATIIADFFRDDMNKELNLGEYKLVDEYDITKIYEVTDANSMVTFTVRFYLYGGILSGWSVEPVKASYDKYRARI